MKEENQGYIVETHDGKTGRTYHHKGLINKKVPVYLFDNNDKLKPPSISGTLYDGAKLRIIGFID